jgi:hypothetical protein
MITRLQGYAFEAQGTQHVIYVDDGMHIQELWWDSNGWHHNDLTAATGAPIAEGEPTAYVFDVDPNFPQGTQHVVNWGSDLHELWWNSNGWHDNDLTTAAGAPPPGEVESDAATGYVFAAQGTQHIIYEELPDARIHELWWDSSCGWHHHDLTAATCAPVAFRPPTGYVFAAQGTQHVVYPGMQGDGSSGVSDGRIHELW